MISVLRKQLKHFTGFLWVIFISMALASLSMIVLRRPTPRETKIASVNSDSIYLNEYQQSVIQVRMQLEMMQNYAKEQGISPEFFMAMTGLNNPEEVAFKELINEKLINTVHSNLSLQLDPEYLKNQIGKSLPYQIFDRTGHLNDQSYKEYLSHLQQSIEEYEDKKENELKRQFVVSSLKNAAYIPQAIISDYALEQTARKSFSILVIPIDSFLEKSKQNGATGEELKDFYQTNKEAYRIPEKRKAEFWTLSRKDYKNKITIEDETVESFYTRNKDSLYRIPAEVKVRKITIRVENMESPESIVRAHNKTEEIYKKAMADPASFEALANEHSDSKEKNGGLLPFFKRGTHDDDFERAAFRLKEKGEIFKTERIDDRYEIMQLVDRRNASYKPLDSARDEIVEKLRDRKAGLKVKSDLDAVMYSLRSNKKAIDEFVENGKLKSEKSDSLEEKDAQGRSRISTLAKKLFSKKKPTANYGYFSYKDDYILFREIDRERSSIPTFEHMKDTVKEELIGKHAKKEQKMAVAEARRLLLNKEESLEALQKKYDARIVKTSSISRDGTISELKGVRGLVEKVFKLTDVGQVAKHKGGSSYYLALLNDITSGDELKSDDKDVFVDREGENQKMRYFNAFIASLTRNARIEKYEKTPQHASVAGDEDL